MTVEAGPPSELDPGGQFQDRLRLLAERFASGDRAALARSITVIERGDLRGAALLREIERRTQVRSPIVGLTGAPGAGKSSLVDALIRTARVSSRTVGVLCIDPSSPVSGGAVLGDRLRMDEHILDPGVFVRSMSARGHAGGIAKATSDAARLLAAFGFDEVIIETVGAGQSEFEVRHVVDTTVLVLNPSTGDDIQLDKAGIMEVADIFVVNKSDLQGADQLVRQLRSMVKLGSPSRWRPPIVRTVSIGTPEGIDDLWRAVGAHRAAADHDDDDRVERATEQSRRSVAALVGSRAEAWALEQMGAGTHFDADLKRGASTSVVSELCARLGLDVLLDDDRVDR